LDTDSDSVFRNETVRDYCEQVGIEFTRYRPYRKNDQAWVEQKNGAVVRRTLVQIGREGASGAQVRKRYHPYGDTVSTTAIPCQRLLADPRTSDEVGRRVNELRAMLDPVRLLQRIRVAQQQLGQAQRVFPSLSFHSLQPKLRTAQLAPLNTRGVGQVNGKCSHPDITMAHRMCRSPCPSRQIRQRT
jgi:hypothetical protein